jgi:hypothetical protein
VRVNRYGLRAWEYYRQHRREELKTITDPEAFFTTLGLEIQEQILQRLPTTQQTMPASDDYDTRVGQHQTAQAMAEEQVLAEILDSPPTAPQ